MTIHYNSQTDLLYLRLEQEDHSITDKRISEDIVLDIGSDNKIIGIEIMDASQHVNLEKVMPIEYTKAS
ncbi:MAG: DUF2283 domain-containing protein [Cytophagales bacterium]|nr:DUF2283 domain-containing protein [Cytophagales bacterium]MCA6366485.1 DUF2283 domain-containing protein [Cytophagales bacterium]MCA6372609.1 DUF2283 domain-containing protein [Cytophagales bacterium]MCA6376825.1 DUF2283 domain-containing protein [Cytophagales bacterium]MCA6383827.1 DUF2283 domain-containing protein [Cytophagales bacterium]